MTDKNVFDLERSINNLDEEKRRLTDLKRKLETDLGSLKNQLRVNKNLPQKEYKSLCRKQEVLNSSVAKTQEEINCISIDIRKKITLKDEIKRELKMIDDSHIVIKLTELKNYYINFAADRSRISSMRAMSAEFAEKLGLIINKI